MMIFASREDIQGWNLAAKENWILMARVNPLRFFLMVVIKNTKTYFIQEVEIAVSIRTISREYSRRWFSGMNTAMARGDA